MMSVPRRTAGFLLVVAAALGIRGRPAVAGAPQVVAAADTPVALGPPVRIALIPRGGAAALHASLTRLAPGQRVFLVLHDLRAASAPGVVFDVYLGQPPGPPAAAGGSGPVGTLNFFALTGGATSPITTRSYDVTEAVRSLAAEGLPPDRLAVTIAADQGAVPDPAAAAMVGRIELIVQ